MKRTDEKLISEKKRFSLRLSSFSTVLKKSWRFVMSRVPDKKDQHLGCAMHDAECINEQTNAGCVVETFICFNCRDLYTEGILDDVNDFSNYVIKELFNSLTGEDDDC